MPSSALTVTQLNRYIKSLLEGDRKLHDVLIRGEIHSFHRHFKTGHLFFSLKDGGSSLKVVMFRSAAAQLQFDPQDGMQVIVRGDIAVFERDGAYQLYAREIIPDGVGAQQMAIEQIKQRRQRGFVMRPTKSRCRRSPATSRSSPLNPGRLCRISCR